MRGNRLESPRTGRIFQAIGLLFACWAVTGLVLTPYPFALINMWTLGVGAFIIWLGRREVRRATDHRAFMENHRAEMHRILGEPLDGRS